MHCVISGLRDPELPVRVDSVFALRSFVEACKGELLDTWSVIDFVLFLPYNFCFILQI
jgi:hypothetical protein